MKILVLQTAFIGDVIMSTPIFRALKSIYPDSQIDALTTPISKALLESNPFVDNVHTFNKSSGIFKKIRSLFSLILQLRKEKYDIAVSIQHSLTSSFIMLASSIRRRIGNQRMKFVTDNATITKGLHNRERVLCLLKPLTIEIYSAETELFPSSNDILKADELLGKLDKSTKIIAIAPGSVRITKKWLPEYFAELTDLLCLKGFSVVFIGASNERELCESIIKESGRSEILNIAGETSLMESAALIHKADLLICNDSSPLHIANAVKTPVFAIFGPTVKSFGCYPYRENDLLIETDLECRPCSKHGGDLCPLGHHKCMKDISPYSIYQKVLAYFMIEESEFSKE